MRPRVGQVIAQALILGSRRLKFHSNAKRLSLSFSGVSALVSRGCGSPNTRTSSGGASIKTPSRFFVADRLLSIFIREHHVTHEPGIGAQEHKVDRRLDFIVREPAGTSREGRVREEE